MVNHGKEITAAIKESTVLHLAVDGTISGSVQGTWKLIDQNKAQLILDGVSFDGIFLRQWDVLAQRYMMTFTALSGKGVAVWGTRMIDMNDHQIVEAVQQDLTLGDIARIKSNLSLPTEGTHESAISWSSSDPSIVSPTGVVDRPAAGAGDATVTLTATIAKGTAIATKSFTITVLQHAKGGMVAQFDFEGNLADSAGNFPAGEVIGGKIGVSGGTLSYGSGVHGQAAIFDGSSGVQLPSGLITSKTYSVSLWVNPDQLTSFTTTFFGAKDTNSWVSVVPQSWDNNTMLWSGSAWYDGITGVKIKTGEWTHLAFTVNNGNVVFYINGVPKFTGTGFPDVFTSSSGTFALGVNWWDVPFKGKMDDLRIYETSLSADQVAELAGVIPIP